MQSYDSLYAFALGALRRLLGLMSMVLWLGCVPALVAAEPLPLAVRDGKPIRILLQWMPQAQFAGYLVAQKRGFFQDEGLPEVELHWTKLGDKPLVRLARGEVDFASAWLTTALQRCAEGLPLVSTAQFMQRSASMLVARKDRNIRTVDDLNGRILLSWGGDFSMEFELFLKRNNIVPAQVLPLSDSLAPFLYGLVDATQAMEYSEYLRLQERGMKPEEMVVFAFSEYNANFVGDGLYTTQEYFAENRTIVAAVRRAVIRGWTYAFAHEDEAIDYVLAEGDAWKFRSNRRYQLNMLRILRTIMEYRVGPDPAQWGNLLPADFESARTIMMEMGIPLQHVRYETFFQEP